MTSFICSLSDDTRTYSVNTDHLPLLNQLPLSLWAKSPTDVGKIHRAPPIEIQIKPLKPISKINQFPVSKEALQGIKPTTEDYKPQGLITPCSSPYNTPSLPERKAKGCEWRFVQDL